MTTCPLDTQSLFSFQGAAYCYRPYRLGLALGSNLKPKCLEQAEPWAVRALGPCPCDDCIMPCSCVACQAVVLQFARFDIAKQVNYNVEQAKQLFDIMEELWRGVRMYAMDTVKQAANSKGIPLDAIGVFMGVSRQYVSNTISRGSTPKADTLARMLDVCGYGLYAIPYDKAPKDALQITAKVEDPKRPGR